LGSITDLTDSAGATAKSYAYDAYGTILESPGTLEQPYTYTGREFDQETGLYYLRARYYAPATGRFLQKDPIGLLSLDNNLYQYVKANPVVYGDPNGHCPWCLVGAGVGAGLNIASQLAANGGNLGQINPAQVGLAAASGLLGGGLGTLTSGLSVTANITANAIGSALISGGLAVIQNKVGEVCGEGPSKDALKEALRGGAYGFLGASLGNTFQSGYKAVQNYLTNAALSSRPQSTQLLTSGITSSPVKFAPPNLVGATAGTTGANIISNSVSNLNQ
jgi:RHS repeat-associated protein